MSIVNSASAQADPAHGAYAPGLEGEYDAQRRGSSRARRLRDSADKAERSGSAFRTGVLFLLSDLITAALCCWALVLLGDAAPAQWTDAAAWTPPSPDAALSQDVLMRAGVLTALVIAALNYGGVYRQVQWEFGEGRRALASGLLIFLAYTTLAVDGSIGVLAALGVAASFAFSALMMLGRMVMRSLGLAQSAMRRKIVLVSEALTPEDLSRELRTSRGMKADVVGAMTLYELFAVLEQPSSLRRRFYETKYRAQLDELTFAFAPTAEEAPELEYAVEALNQEGATAIIAVALPGLVGRRLDTMRVFGGDILFAHVGPGRPATLELFAKRALDVTGAAAGLLILSPLLALITAGLSLGGRSPFFSQVRVGKDRARFRCYKFRTMVPDAEQRLQSYLDANPEAQAEWDSHQKLKNDPRITWLGGFLRKTSLDELPQLWNVLRGDMSLVGPRPIVAPEVPGYPQDAAYYEGPAFEGYARCRPGITGVWQVSGRSQTTHDERVRLDCWYARNWTIWLDLVVILKTVRAAVFGSAWA